MQKDYTKMPMRRSSIAEEIESKRILQSEQIKSANMANAYLLYYLSGGNESVVAAPKDKVRPEDQDLRGWFAEKYGDKYLDYLTSDLECSKTNPERVQQIMSDFTETPFGFILRTGAVNEYHMGRIVTYAKNVNTARAEAKKYSKELAILCAKLLLTGEPPNNNIFSILHSSIRTWYKMQGIQITLTFEEHISKAPATGINKTHNHTTYVTQIITSLFDMLAFSKPAESWVTGTIKPAIEELDGVTDSDLAQYEARARGADTRSRNITSLINEAVERGWNVKPKMTAGLKADFAKSVQLVVTQGYGNTDTEGKLSKMYIPVYQNLQAYKDAAALAIGAEVPRDLRYNIRIISLMVTSLTTNSLWSDYDQWQSLKDQRTAQEIVMQENTMALQTGVANTKTLAQWHKTPAIVLYGEFSKRSKREDGSHISTDWMMFVYESVKQGLALDYVTSSFKLTQGGYGPYPEIHIRANAYVALDIKTETTPTTILEGFNISRSILLYAKALSGVSPAAYWSTSLSHRIVFRPRQPTADLPACTEVYLYSANMKTGGISSDNALMAIVKGDTETAAGTISGLLPDIPEYKPGTNVQLSSSLNNSFSLKVAEDPSLQQWLRASMKDRFQYAYVIKSAWDPRYYSKKGLSVEQIEAGEHLTPRYRAPSSFLGSRLSMNSLPEGGIGHIDWLNATDWAGQNFKRVKTFGPNIETIKRTHWNNQFKDAFPSFFEAKGALSSTQMTCVAYPKSAVSKIVAFMETVPLQIQKMLNRVNNKPNSPNHEAAVSLQPDNLYGDQEVRESSWPEYMNLKNAFSGELYDGFQNEAFLMDMNRLTSFLRNRTEALFIDDIATATKRAYERLQNKKLENHPSGYLANEGRLIQNRYNEFLWNNYFDVKDFGVVYEEYMGLLGAIAYFNSYEMLMDTPSHRNYAEWAKPFKGAVDRIVSSVIASATPIVIYQDTINDTEDVSNLNKVLKGLGAFEDMTELPVFDVVDFNVMWTSLGAQASAPTSNPFDSNGLPIVGSDGLKALAYRGLKNGYGDVFHNTIMSACVMRPRLIYKTAPAPDKYMYSSLRVPVNTRGISSKVYGMRTGSVSSFTTGVNSIPGKMLLTGSGGLTYTGLAGMAGVVFAGALGVAMFKNIASETAFSDKRFRIDDID